MPAISKASGTGPESELLQEGLAFLGQAREVPALSPSQVEEIARRLKRQAHRPRHGVLWPALVTIAMVLIGGGTVAVAKGGLASLPVVGAILESLFVATPPATQAKAARPQPAGPKPAVREAPVVNTAIPLLGPPATPPAEPLKAAPPQAPTVRSAAPFRRELALRDSGELRERRQAAPLPGPAMPPPTAEEAKNPLVEESQSFASIIGSWHRTRNASMTLTMLGTHEQRYPTGFMRLESRVLRAEIYLAVGRERESLSVLDTLSLAGIPRAREMQLVRGELRIKLGRCAEGKRDLDEVLAKSIADPLAKRAAQALSQCQ
jgi:hypothetical protein